MSGSLVVLIAGSDLVDGLRARFADVELLAFADVDVLREGWIRSYQAEEPDHPAVFRRGQMADAEPAVPGWRFAVDDLFRTGKQEP